MRTADADADRHPHCGCGCGCGLRMRMRIEYELSFTRPYYTNTAMLFLSFQRFNFLASQPNLLHFLAYSFRELDFAWKPTIDCQQNRHLSNLFPSTNSNHPSINCFAARPKENKVAIPQTDLRGIYIF